MELRSDGSLQTRALWHDNMRGYICKLIGVRNSHGTRFNEACGRISKHGKSVQTGSVLSVPGLYNLRAISASSTG